MLRDYPDGVLASVPPEDLAREVVRAVQSSGATGLVVFDSSGVTGHRDHAAATADAVEAAGALDLPVLAWTLPRAVADQLNDEFGTGFIGHDAADVDLVLAVDRDRQRMASLAHASQAVPTSMLWRGSNCSATVSTSAGSGARGARRPRCRKAGPSRHRQVTTP